MDNFGMVLFSFMFGVVVTIAGIGDNFLSDATINACVKGNLTVEECFDGRD